jgi:hypothetical protein
MQKDRRLEEDEDLEVFPFVDRAEHRVLAADLRARSLHNAAQ